MSTDISHIETFPNRAAHVLAGGPGTFSKAACRYPAGLVPEALVRGGGAYVYGTNGHRYLDLVAALGAVLLGHAHPTVNTAAMAQMAQGTSFSMLHPLEVEVAELLCDVVPCFDMVRFCRNGTDATNAAVRLARAITGRHHVIAVGYHGGGSDWYGCTTDKAAGILPHIASYNHQTAWGDLSTVPRHVFDDLAALIVEVPPCPWEETDAQARRTLQLYADTAYAHTALFILDEIVTWPRYNLSGAQGLYGVIPDLCTVSKAIANGLPLAALGGKRQYMDRLNKGDIFMSYTFAGETTALAAAKAVITTLRDTDELANLRQHGQRLGDDLQALFREYDLPVKLLGNYARLSVKWQDMPGVATSQELRTLWMAEMARHGVLLSYGGLFPMTCWTDRENSYFYEAAGIACLMIATAIATHRVQAVLPCPVIHNSSVRRE